MAIDDFIQPYLDDYTSVTGEATDKFICPLTLRRCERSEVIRGHIVNEKIPYAFNTRTIPVYGKPDHFYGTRVENTFIRFASLGLMSPFEMLQHQKSFKVRLRSDGPWFDAFLVPDKDAAETAKHLPVIPVTRDGHAFHVGLRGASKSDPGIVPDSANRLEIQMTERHLASHWIAAMLKVAHFTLFALMGYKAIFDPCQNALRSLLAKYFYDGASREDAGKYFHEFENSVKVVGLGTGFAPDTPYSPADFDTLRDQRILMHAHMDRHFAVTLMYKLPHITLAVTLPQSPRGQDIAVSTMLYNKLMEEDPAWTHDVTPARYDGSAWRLEPPLNVHYQPPFNELEVRL